MDSNSGPSRHSATFNFVVKNFTESITNSDGVFSLPCVIRNIPWKLLASIETKKNECEVNEKYLGIFLYCLADNKNESDCICHPDWNCSAKVKFSLLNQNNDDKNVVEEVDHVFHSGSKNRGLFHFISWDKVTNPDEGFIDDNTVCIRAEVEVSTPMGIQYKVKNDNNKSKFELLESERKIQSLESEVTKLKSDLALEKCNALQLQKDLSDEKSEFQLLKNDMVNKQAEIDLLKNDVANEKSELQLLKNDVANEKAELQRLIKDVESEKENARSKMKTLETTITNVVSLVVLQISEMKNIKESVVQNGGTSSSTGDIRSELKDALLSLINSKLG